MGESTSIITAGATVYFYENEDSMTPVSELKPMDVFVNPQFYQDQTIYLGGDKCYIERLGIIEMPYWSDEVEVIGRMQFVPLCERSEHC